MFENLTVRRIKTVLTLKLIDGNGEIGKGVLYVNPIPSAAQALCYLSFSLASCLACLLLPQPGFPPPQAQKTGALIASQ